MTYPHGGQFVAMFGKDWQAKGFGAFLAEVANRRLRVGYPLMRVLAAPLFTARSIRSDGRWWSAENRPSSLVSSACWQPASNTRAWPRHVGPTRGRQFRRPAGAEILNELGPGRC
jgi:hypothetical protein